MKMPVNSIPFFSVYMFKIHEKITVSASFIT